jgi:hypothetical protein
MELLLRLIFSPITFGLLFLAPLIAQCMTAIDLQLFAIPNLLLGLVIGGAWGLIAKLKGSWLWIK